MKGARGGTIRPYLVAPGIWELVSDRGPDIAQARHLTTTSDGHLGDPINLVLIGSETELVNAMQRTGWLPADPITLETSLRIATDPGRPGCIDLAEWLVGFHQEREGRSGEDDVRRTDGRLATLTLKPCPRPGSNRTSGA
jgi:hypothetical protein